jgi:hypothetical protein
MDVSRELALGTIRFSLGRETTEADIERAVEVFPGVVEKVRKLAGVLGRAGGRSGGQSVGEVAANSTVQQERGAMSEQTVRPSDRPTVR